MKILALNFIKADDVPRPTRNTEKKELAQAILEYLRKAPKGQGVTVQLDTVTKYTRYGLLKTMQRLGAKNIRTRIDLAKKTLFVVQEDAPTPAPTRAK
jgi:hypothetical protein